MGNGLNSSGINRRKVLQSVSVGLGVTFLNSQDVSASASTDSNNSVPDIEVNEVSGNNHSIYVKAYRVTDSGEKVQFEDTFEVSANESYNFYDVLDENSDLNFVEYSIDGGETRREYITKIVQNISNHIVHFTIMPDGKVHQSELHADLPSSTGGAKMTHDMRIFIYPNNSEDDYLAEQAEPVLESLIDDVIANTPVSDGYADIDYRHPGLGDSNRDELYDNWENYVTTNMETYNDYGSHLCLSANISAGEGLLGTGFGDFDDAFVSNSWAVAGERSSTAEMENVWIHEVLHNFNDPNASRYDQANGDDETEHTLGTFNYYDDVTPFATTYESTYAKYGYCGSTDWDGGYTQTLSSCTARGLDASFRGGFNERSDINAEWFDAKQISIDDPWATYNISPSIPYPVVFD